MRKFLKYFVFGMILLLVGIAIGFHVTPIKVGETVSASYFVARPNSIWEKAGLPVTTETSTSIGEELEKKGYLRKIENSGNYDYIWTLEKVNN